MTIPERVELACRFLAGAPDADRDSTPFFYIRTDGDGFCYLDHVFWYDTCHVPGRCLDAMLNAKHVFGTPIDEAAVQAFARYHKEALRGYAGFAGYANPETGEKTIEFHNLRESLLGLLALLHFRNDAEAGDMARSLIAAVVELTGDDGEIRPDALGRLQEHYVCNSLDGIICYTLGRFIGPLVEYERHTGETDAVELARRLADLCLREAFLPDGRLGDRAGRHVHSITATVNGIVDLGRLLDDARYILGGRQAYDVGLQDLRSSFGWFSEGRGRTDGLGEANCTGDAIQAAVLLGQCGYADYFGDAERMLRGWLLPSQLLEVSAFRLHERPRSDAQRVTPERLRGGWGLGSVNEQVMAGWGYVATYDNTAGPVQALCELWQAVVTRGDDGVRLNMLLDHDSELARVSTSLPEEGRVELRVRVADPLFVRIPSWLKRREIAVTVDGRSTERLGDVDGYLRIAGGAADRTISLAFPLHEAVTEETINGKAYTIRWKGDQVTGISPPGERLPMFPPVGE